jgi:hypothetical protein
VEAFFVDSFLDAHLRPLPQVVLDLDATDAPIHSTQEGRFFPCYYGNYCYLPLYIFAGDFPLGDAAEAPSVSAPILLMCEPIYWRQPRRWLGWSFMICIDCECPLAGPGFQKYCPQCGHIYKRTTDGYQKTESVYLPELTLQPDGGSRNPAFKTSLKGVYRNPRPAPSKVTPFDQGIHSGFSDKSPPLLHFVWMGTPQSPYKLQAAFDWAKLLKSTWLGVCIWIDENCFELFRTMTEHEAPEALPTLTEDQIRPVAMRIRTGSVPVYFALIDEHLEALIRKYEGEAPTLHILKAAIDFERQNEPPFSLVQVASDILRVILLRYYGGAYFDFDVSPSSYCKGKKLPDPKAISMGEMAFVCHRKDLINENDIIFADPSRKTSVLDGLLDDMSKFYKSSREARADYLRKRLSARFGEDTDNVIAKYRAGRTPSSQLLNKLAILVQEDIGRGRKDAYLRAVDEEVLEFVGILNDSIELATFQGFQFYPAHENGEKWDRIKVFFSHQTLTKPFYSWKDPGASAAIERIEAATKIQAAIRSYLVRASLKKYRLRGLTKAYNADVSYIIYEGATFCKVLRRDNERYCGIVLIDAWVREFRPGTISVERRVKDLQVFVHQDILRPAFVEDIVN